MKVLRDVERRFSRESAYGGGFLMTAGEAASGIVIVVGPSPEQVVPSICEHSDANLSRRVAADRAQGQGTD